MEDALRRFGPFSYERRAMEGIVDGRVIRDFREKLELTRKQFCVLCQFSVYYLRDLELDKREISQRAKKVILDLIALDRDGKLDVTVARPPRLTKLSQKGIITEGNVTSTYSEWRECPQCHKLKFYTNRRTYYCSTRCQKDARRQGKFAPNTEHKSYIRCPHCGGVFRRATRKNALSAAENKVLGKAEDDAFRQMASETLGLTLLELLRYSERGIRALLKAHERKVNQRLSEAQVPPEGSVEPAPRQETGLRQSLEGDYGRPDTQGPVDIQSPPREVLGS